MSEPISLEGEIQGPAGVVFRPLAPEDSMEELTLLVRGAYARLAAMGLRYLATWQGVDVTRQRCLAGECWVGVREGALVATVVLVYPAHRGSESPAAWYNRPGVAAFHQFAVQPELQGSGVGGALLELVEKRAAALGAKELALDTAEGAHHLIAYYAKRGWRHVGTVDWSETNYVSVVMSKAL